MNTIKSIIVKSVAMLAMATMFAGCGNLDEKWYSEVTPDTFFSTKDDVLSILYRPFTHTFWYEGIDRWYLQEYTADQICQPKRGGDWYDGGIFFRLHYHSWTQDDNHIYQTWRGTSMAIALVLEARRDLQGVDYEKLGLTSQDRDDHINQLNTLLAYYYLRALDYFGNFPIYLERGGEVVGRSEDKIVYSVVENLLREALTKTYMKQKDVPMDGLSRGAAATLLARLYFNAVPYIGEEHFAECAKLCEEIIAGDYGYYDIDDTWNAIHSFENDRSPAMIWNIPSQMNYLEYNWFFKYTHHKNMIAYFGIDGVSGYNGHGLTPSCRPDGTPYTEYKLGNPYAKFNNEDLRKRQYVYQGGTNYEGMFVVGEQRMPSGTEILGNKEYSGQPLVFVDYCARMSELPKGASPSTLRSTMADGEENSLIRPVKVPIASENKYRWAADLPILRLEEVYYMLAECKLRSGDKRTAAALIEKIRQRAFENHEDPDPVTEQNLDKWRMIDEWGIEFLGEGRRRTDLIRWDMFTTESWWDHQPSDASRNRFPVPTEAINGNNKLLDDPIRK